MSEASFRVVWTGTHDISALDRLVSLVDGLDPSTLGLPMALHAGGDRIVSLSVRPADARDTLGYSAEVRPSVVTMPVQSTANERLLMGSADAVILTDGGRFMDDAAAAQKLDDILESLTARGRRSGSVPVLIDLPGSASRSRAFWLKSGAKWGSGLHVIESPESSSKEVFQACWEAICACARAAAPEKREELVAVPAAELSHFAPEPRPLSLFRRAWHWCRQLLG